MQVQKKHKKDVLCHIGPHCATPRHATLVNSRVNTVTYIVYIYHIATKPRFIATYTMTPIRVLNLVGTYM